MHPEPEKWGWKQVTVVGKFDRGSGTKRWKCNHCNNFYNGSYSRVRAHLLGFNGLGVKPCTAVDTSTRQTFRTLDGNRLARKLMKKKHLSIGANHQELLLDNLSRSMRNLAAEDVDGTVARFLYGVGLNVDLVNSSYFREMVKALGLVGSRYELPSKEKLCSWLLNEKVRLEKVWSQARDSWPYTGCTILCANQLNGSLGCLCVNFFVASPRGVMFLKEVDIVEIEGDGPDNQFIKELGTAITEVGPSNVVQVVTQLSGQASEAFETVILSKFPHIFWSYCTSHSILLLMEEIAEQLDWFKCVVSCSKEIEQQISAFQNCSSNTNSILKGLSDSTVSQKFAPSYFLVRRITESKASLCHLLASEEWKQWRVNNGSECGINIEAVASRDDFGVSSQLMLEVYEPFVTLLSTLDADKSAMGDVYNWRILSLEALRSKGNIDGNLLNQLESLIDERWDKLFSPLHGVAYILHPKYFGKEQSKDKSLIRAWNATIERYEANLEGQRVLREELGSYWGMEGSFGETDAVECRDKMEAVSWWENFGFEAPHLQTMAIKILSQISSSAILGKESWQCGNTMTSKEAVDSFGLGGERSKDFVFVRNNLRLQSIRNKNMVCFRD